MNLGIRTELAGFWKHKSHSADLYSFSLTYDYYFHSGNKIFAPFIGAGLGYYFCEANGDAEEMYKKSYAKFNNPNSLVRAGVEIGKFRTALVYNIIRKQSELNYSNRNCDNISLNIGFYLGGGKWKK